MAEITLYNMQGKESGKATVSDALFAVPVKSWVIHEAIVAQDANSRTIHAHVKDRSEVRGGGKKPWKQKGTGRARHGSTRSPIWVGGGVAHGPQDNRNFSKKINKATKRLALAMALSDKREGGALLAIDEYTFTDVKTKVVANLRKNLPQAAASALFVVTKGDTAMRRAARNLPRTATILAQSLNVRDIVKYGVVVASQAALREIEENFAE